MKSENLGYILSIVFGILSNIVWSIVFIPQFLKNIKNKDANAISYYMILFILIGNTLSYLSAHGKNLSYIIVYGSFYHILLTSSLLIQWIYYKVKNNEIFYIDNQDYFYLNTHEFNNIYILKKIIKIRKVYISLIFITCLLTIKITSDILNNIVFYNIIGWTSTILFISARIPQILLNSSRKTTDGLSITSFILITIANILFLISLMIRIIDSDIDNKKEYLFQNLQWLTGCTVTVIFDAIIFAQYYRYDYKENISNNSRNDHLARF